jgi:hypothetical protein
MSRSPPIDLPYTSRKIGTHPTITPDKPESQYTRGTRESDLCQNSQNSGRASTLGRTRALKTPLNPNRFQQSFRARATPRTPDKPGSPPTLRTSPLSLSLYSTRMNMGALYGAKPHSLHTFYHGEQSGTYRRSKVVLWPKIGQVRPTCQADRPCTWPGGQVSSLHSLWALDTLSTASSGHVNKTFFVNAKTHGQPAKVVWPVDHTLAWLSPCFVPCHFLMS